MYHKREHYTLAELDAFAKDDLLNDAVCAERQAAEGPFYPELGVTKEMLLNYAAKCRAAVARFEAAPEGALHRAVLAKGTPE